MGSAAPRALTQATTASATRDSLGNSVILEVGTSENYSDPESRAPTLCAFCFKNSVKQSLLHWAGGPKPVLMPLREESKPQNINHKM